MNKQRTTLYLESDLIDRVKEESNKERRSMSAMVSYILENYLNEKLRNK